MFEDVRPGDRVRITIETVFVMASQGRVHVQGTASFPKEIVKSITVIERSFKLGDIITVNGWGRERCVVAGIDGDAIWAKRPTGGYISASAEDVYHVD